MTSEAAARDNERSSGREGTTLVREIQDALTFQRYDRQEQIAGASIYPLRKHRSENGSFVELFRLSEGDLDFGKGSSFTLRQVSASFAEPGRINAFHIHPKLPQNEIWCVLQGLLLVWLVDCRQDSATEGVRQKVILTGEEPVFLHIPAGVAHGYRAGPSGATLIYGMDQQFDIKDPNEGRLAWDHFGRELWEEDRG